MAAPETRLRVLTYNCWGLKFVAKNLEERIEAIAHELANSTYDIICLQEIWVFAHFERVRDRVSRQLQYSRFFHSGALGAGLAIFSRFPIVSTAVHPYSLNGTPLDVAAGDWFVGKAAAHVVILHPILGQTQIFNTHLYAKGGEDGPEHLRAHRLVNAWEFAKLARQAAEAGKYVIALGDFNSIPPTLPMTVIQEHTGLTDSWVVTHPNVDPGLITSPMEAVTRLGITADSPLNSWSAGKGYAQNSWGKRLDYVLYRHPVRVGQHIPSLKAVEAKVVFMDKVPGRNFSYSDHFGLEVVLEANPNQPPPLFIQPELSAANTTAVIQALTACYRFSTQRAKRELFIFGLNLFLLVGVVIGTAWLPKPWINPIFILFTIIMAWLATTMLYEGFIFGRWEGNALTNVIEELEFHRKGLDILNGVRD